MKVIGITGTIGAGKGTIVEYLMTKKGFSHYSVRGYLISEINKRGMTVNRDSMVSVANELRAQHSPSFIVEELYREAMASGKDCVIESIRTPGEVDALRLVPGFLLLAVDARPEVRYERIFARGSETDQISYQTFLENEAREMNSHDPNHQNLHQCITMADAVIYNNGTIEELYRQVEAWLGSDNA
jgi:dephospho-CoA kinase